MDWCPESTYTNRSPVRCCSKFLGMPLSWDPAQEGGDLEERSIVADDFLLDFLLEMSNFRVYAWD